MEGGHSTLSLVLALAVGVLAQSIARHLRLPGIVVLLLAGSALGPDGLGWIEPRSLGSGFFAVVDLAVAVILFEGGLNLQITRLRREQAAIRRLVSWGALMTLGGASVAAQSILGWDWGRSLLFGSLVVVTGPTVVGPLVSELRLRTRVATVLTAEGVLIDPIGAILAALVLKLVLTPDAAASGALGMVVQLGFGAVAGLTVGFLVARLLRIRRLVPEGYENIFVLASVLVLFEGCEVVAANSGIMAVTLAGVVVGNSRTPVDRDLREFKDQLTVLLIGLLFVLLAADVRFADVQALGVPGLAVVGALVLVVRPLVAAASALGSELSWRERVFVGWIAPRGIVAAAIASLVAGAMERSGFPGGPELRALVFLTIAVTVVQAGLTAALAARLLAVRLPSREGVAILGSQGLGLAIAAEFARLGKSVVFVDANPQNCRRAEEAGFSVVFGNAVEERTLQRARLENFEAALGVTPNQTVNAVFVTRARELFRVPRGYVAVEREDTGMVAELVERGTAAVLFEAAHDVERWDVRSRHGELEVVRCVYEPVEPVEGEPGEEPPVWPQLAERGVFLTLERGASIAPMTTSVQPKAGDVSAVAIHLPEREEVIGLLAERGWRPVPVEEEAKAS